MASIYRLGDGQRLCNKHLREQFPGMPEPVIGWTSGKCDLCIISKAAVALGRKGGQAKSERKARSSAENGKKGGRPRKKPKA